MDDTDLPEDPIERLRKMGADMSFLDQVPPPLGFDQLVANSRKILQTPYGEQDANGTDISLIKSNLMLSPLERLRRADSARRSAIWIHRHARRIR